MTMPAVCQLLVTSVLKNGPYHTSYDDSFHSYDCQNLILASKVWCFYETCILIIMFKDAAMWHDEQVVVTSVSVAFES
jgi:hypothetical protein